MAAFLLAVAAFVPASHAALTGYLKIPDIPGESQRAEHEDEIDIHGISWGVQAQAADDGSGRTRARAEVSAITLKKYYDASSPYLFLSAAQGKSFDEITITFIRSNPDSGSFPYLTITLSNCVVTNYQVTGGTSVDDKQSEEVGLSFETINIKYVVQADDHSAGDEHEIEYDIAAGV
ncbi:type VI secretion system tube protein Hcp [Pelagicoccus enzymogenes]|uniref:Hcp family type VI secretion system effector n=1 Tax=Pelagicoccus enzymogenes TaxID=2773457 RepID=UPI00280C4043|nr:type VI secretion system tube protein Hcp [Pelagicoccus enzymogenes]MDQ8199226.1 type VI secretion system tube protein Hcp [Pelagicoccus enzymogenes]